MVLEVGEHPDGHRDSEEDDVAIFGLDDSGYPDVDSNEFLELQMRSKFELDKLISGYEARDRKTERRNHALTQSRREMLRGIWVESKVHRGPEGGGLIYWDKMLEFARKAVAEFNKEDIQRGT